MVEWGRTVDLVGGSDIQGEDRGFVVGTGDRLQSGVFGAPACIWCELLRVVPDGGWPRLVRVNYIKKASKWRGR